MGEMADDAYDRAIDEMLDRDRYGDYFGEGFGFGPGLHRAPPRHYEKCPHCGQLGLERTGRGADSYLFKSGLGRHICHSRVVNDFDDLTAEDDDPTFGGLI